MGTTLLGTSYTKSQTQFIKKKKFMTQRGNTLEIKKKRDIQQKKEKKRKIPKQMGNGGFFVHSRTNIHISSDHSGKKKNSIQSNLNNCKI